MLIAIKGKVEGSYYIHCDNRGCSQELIRGGGGMAILNQLRNSGISNALYYNFSPLLWNSMFN